MHINVRTCLGVQLLHRFRGPPQLAGHDVQPTRVAMVLGQTLGMDDRLSAAVRVVRILPGPGRGLRRHRHVVHTQPQLFVQRHRVLPAAERHHHRFRILLRFPEVSILRGEIRTAADVPCIIYGRMYFRRRDVRAPNTVRPLPPELSFRHH